MILPTMLLLLVMFVIRPITEQDKTGFNGRDDF
jgi:hypothetical protein